MGKVLMADDSPILLKIGRSHLEKGQHKVLEAHDGREALTLARAEKPDIIFLDAEMPEMDGWEACEQLKKDPATQSIPVYMCTGHDLEGPDKDRLKTVGADGHLQKPYKPEDLLSLVEKSIK
jgi:CheY-like chemotaxis protein